MTLLNAFGNMLMFHGLLQIPHVDGVYWTLEVELLFYAGMLALFATGRLRVGVLTRPPGGWFAADADVVAAAEGAATT